jgi:hypothetical protein
LKGQRALMLAASDLTQLVAAAKALAVEQDGDLSRALESALVVSFMRPLGGEIRIPVDLLCEDPWAPTEDEVGLFTEVKTLRDSVYAHTDQSSGRTISLSVEHDGEIVRVAYREDWVPIDRDRLPAFISFCEAATYRLQRYAAIAQLILDGEHAVTTWDKLWPT